jgi:MFS family permease
MFLLSPIMEHKYGILTVTTLSTLMAAIDSTIVYLALPAMGQTFHSGISYLTIVVVSYLISTTIMLVPSIEITKRIGNRSFYIIGFSIFTTSSLIIAISSTIDMVIVFRFIEGIGAGIMTSSDIPIILGAFKKGERGKAIGLNSIAWSIGTLIGPVLGGFIVAINWRYIFLINVPIGIIAIIAGSIIIRKDKPLKARVRYKSTVSMAIFLIPLIIGIAFINTYYLLIALVILPIFLYIQIKHPVIDKKLLKNIKFSLITVASFLESFVFFSVLFALSLYFQSDLGYSSIETGLIIVTYPLASIVSSPVGGMLYDKYSNPEAIMAAGALLECIPVLFIGIYFKFIPELLLVAGFGGSFFWAPSTTMITDALGERFRVQANNAMFIMRDIGIITAISILPIFILHFSGINVSLGDIFVSRVRINISAGISAYLIITSIISLSSLMFIYMYHIWSKPKIANEPYNI